MVASPARTPALIDAKGRRIALGGQLARGGEGTVYHVANTPQLVAKVYHGDISSEKAEKLAAMAQLSSERLRNIAAWPIDTLHERAGGPIRGILMPNVQGHREIHFLYGPKTRRAAFPDANLPFLIHTAANVARAFAVIHEHGHVIGDVNHGSVMVSQQGIVKLVDCDSFQIFFGQRHYLCRVGTPTHTPPELQGKSFAGLIRTPNHDAFGLAVLIFQLLFLGRHPFSGTYLGNGESSLERSIEEYRFAYGPGAAQRLMRQPPATPPLDIGTSPAAALFERAFTRLTGETSGRPTAKEWVSILTEAKKHLAVCSRHSGHYYPRTMGTCPWCRIEAATGVVAFNVTLSRGGVGNAGSVTLPGGRSFDLDGLWAKIEAIADPGPAPVLPLPPNLPTIASERALEQRLEVRRLDRLMKVTLASGLVVSPFFCTASASLPAAVNFFLAIAIIGCFVVSYLSNRWKQRNPARQAALGERAIAEGKLRDMGQRWQREASNASFLEQRADLMRQREGYRSLPDLRQQKIREQASHAREHQLERYLDRFRIASASIPNIGDSRKATLQSHWIETAADVTPSKLLAVPGFGPTLSNNLLTWRSSLEARFRFDPQKALDPADLADIDREIANQRSLLEASLSAGPARLQRTVEQITAARTALRAAADQAQLELAQAQADLRVL